MKMGLKAALLALLVAAGMGAVFVYGATTTFANTDKQ